MSNEMKRRQFLKESAIGVSALTVGLEGGAQEAGTAGGARGYTSGSSEERVGRPVRVVSIGFEAGKHPLEWIASQVDRRVAHQSMKPEIQPPRMFPRPATINGIQAYFPIEAMLKWRARLRYSGNQKM